MAKKEQYNDINLQFDSLAAFSRHIAAGKTQKAFAVYYDVDEGGKIENLASHSGGSEFVKHCGTHSFEEAERLLKEGDPESMELLKKYGFEPAAKKYNFGQRRKITPAVVGFAPIVPNAIAGVPVAMQRVTTQQVKTKVVNVVLSVVYGWGTDKKDYAQYAAKVLNGCLTLEKRGIRVNLYAFIGTKKEGQSVSAIVKIKDSKQAIDPLSVAYPIINASFLRRHVFRLIETQPGISEKFVKTYGSPFAFVEEIKKCLPKTLQTDDTIITGYYERNSLDKAFAGVK